MKIRNGFVSNSSSSSFIVIFPFEPKNAEEVEKLLWENNESVQNSYNFSKKSTSDFYNNAMGMTFEEFKKQSSEAIFKEILEQGSNNYLQALAENNSDCYFSNGKLTVNWLSEEYFKNDYVSLDELMIDIEKNKKIQEEIEDFDWENKTEEDFDNLNQVKSYILTELAQTLKEMQEMQKEHNGVLYGFSFSDECQFYGALEHGGTFNNLPHIVENHH